MTRKNLFENWTHEEYAEEYEQLLIDNRKLRKRVAQLEGEESIPDAWWKDRPKLAQKVMKRTIERNDKVLKANDDLRIEIDKAEKEATAGRTLWVSAQKACKKHALRADRLWNELARMRDIIADCMGGPDDE